VRTSRAEAFSDGVLAIAITLLILEVHVPGEVATGELPGALAHQWPSYASYAVSFAIIGIIWVNHHAMFDRLAQVTRGLLFLNLGLLMSVSFLPFPTALLADYVRGGANAHIAAATYGANMTVIGLMFLTLWAYLIQNPDLLAEGFTVDDARSSFRRTVWGPVLYGASIGLAFWNALACLVLYGALAVYFMLPGYVSAAGMSRSGRS
jgi:uncharacterized membrane protein